MKFTITLLIFTLVSFFCVNAQNRTFTFTVNTKDYQVNETRLNDYFGAAFNALVQRNVTKQKDFELWSGTFEVWKNLAYNGRYNFTTYGTHMGSTNYSGESTKELLGLKKDGSPASGNPNKEDNLAMRMRYLNGYIEAYIIDNATEFRVDL